MVAVFQTTNEEQRGGLKEEIRMELTPGNYTISIAEDPMHQTTLDVKAWLWLEGSEANAIHNPLTGKPCSSMWHTLCGRHESLNVCIQRPITIHALCLEKTGYESKGGIKVRYLPLTV